MDPSIRLRSAVALVGGFPVLAGVDLDVARAEVVLLEGANGAGKTSILRACAGLVRVVAGEAIVLGHDLRGDPRPVRRRVGLFGHATSLYDDLGVEANVRFAVRAARGDQGRIGPALDRLGLDGRLRHAAVSSLSAGQRRRVALATILARQPEVWLLDEPHAGLDAEHRDLLDRIVAEAAAAGASIVLASHEAERARGLAHRVVRVAGGTTADRAAPVRRATVGGATVGGATVGGATAGAVPAAGEEAAHVA